LNNELIRCPYCQAYIPKENTKHIPWEEERVELVSALKYVQSLINSKKNHVHIKDWRRLVKKYNRRLKTINQYLTEEELDDY
jgi:glycerol-3-phosphate cytidylyltransferase-like family protein